MLSSGGGWTIGTPAAGASSSAGGGYRNGAQLNGISGRTTLMFEEPAPRLCRIVLRFPDITDNIKAMVYASAYGDSGYEVGVEGANIIVREVEFGVVSGSTIQSTAHNWTGNQPRTIEIDLINGGIDVYLDESTTALFQVAASSLTKFSGYDNIGYVSAVDGATVSEFVPHALEPEFDAAGEVAVIVAGGALYATNDAGELVLIESGLFRSSGYVSLAAHKQIVYGVDGQNARKFQLSDYTASFWTPSDGDLPGKNGDGTTRAALIASHRDRLAASADPVDPQNIFFCRIGDPDNWDTGESTEGAAFALSTARPGLIGEPVKAMITTTNNVLLIGCNRSVWRFYGDPVLGVDIAPVTMDYGASDAEAMQFVRDGAAVMHSPDGFVSIQGDSAVSVNEATVKRYLEQTGDDRGTRRTQVRRDPAHNGIHIFLSVPEATSATVHFWYDDRIGNLVPGEGGFFPDTFAVGHEPMASCFYRGELLLCCRDGYVRVFDDAATDDDGTPIASSCGILIDEGDLKHDTILSRMALMVDDDSGDLSYRIYGGITPQEAVEGSHRQLLLSGTVGTLRPHLEERKVRSPALLLELYHGTASAPWRVDRLEVATRTGRIMRRRQDVALPTPPDQFPAPQSASAADSITESGPGVGSDLDPYSDSFGDTTGSTIPEVELTLFSYRAPDLDFDGLPDYLRSGGPPPDWGAPAATRTIYLREVVSSDATQITLRKQDTVSGGTITTTAKYTKASGEWDVDVDEGHFGAIVPPSADGSGLFLDWPSANAGQLDGSVIDCVWFGGDTAAPDGATFPLASGGPDIDSAQETKIVFGVGVARNLPISGTNDGGFSLWTHEDLQIAGS